MRNASHGDKQHVNPTTIQVVGAVLFALAIVHTFSTKFFQHLAQAKPAHAGLWHLLGEVEVAFGFWALVMVLGIFALNGSTDATTYVDSLSFREPLFVFAIMVISGTRPILQLALSCVRAVARLMPMPSNIAFYFATLAFVPLLGSFITEPAAMTLAALILRDRYFAAEMSNKMKYATLGVLLVNVSIGGTLTPFAAPPVLMVAGKWGWDTSFMLATFGWKAALAVFVNTALLTLAFRDALRRSPSPSPERAPSPVPPPLIAAHVLFMVAVVAFAHHPAIFMGLLLFFLGVAQAYERHQDRLILREGLLVAFFLAGLVVLGGMQAWWLQPLLLGMSANAVFFGAAGLTAITDNAALTYLGSLVEGLNDAFKYALVAGAVAGGGLTVIANAPNPAGFAILRGCFHDGAIHPAGLFIAALPPTLVAILAFWLL